MTAMTSARVLAVALAVGASSVVAAHAQSQPWPTNAPQSQAQAGWPSSAPQAQPQQAPWPANAPQAQPQPQQAPWPSNPQPMAPTGPSMGGPPMAPTAAQQECVREFATLRQDVEKKGIAARTGNEKKVTREEMCKLVTIYSTSEAKWVKYAAVNMAKCGIPKPIVEQIKVAHSHTDDARKKLCAAGPGQAGPATPTLSDALGTATLPNRETEKRKSGGTLDTLTGNALAR
jgi:hypothetical protein